MTLTWVYNNLYTNWAWHITQPKGNGSGCLLDLCLLGFNIWLKPMVLGLASCQNHIFLGSTRSRAQVYWVWQLARLMFAQSQHMAKTNGIGPGNLSDPRLFGLSTWLKPMALGFFRLPTWPTQVCWAQQLDPRLLRLRMWPNSGMLGLTAHQTYVRVESAYG